MKLGNSSEFAIICPLLFELNWEGKEKSTNLFMMAEWKKVAQTLYTALFNCARYLFSNNRRNQLDLPLCMHTRYYTYMWWIFTHIIWIDSIHIHWNTIKLNDDVQNTLLFRPHKERLHDLTPTNIELDKSLLSVSGQRSNSAY